MVQQEKRETTELTEQDEEYIRQNLLRVRSCNKYYSEYKECTKLRSRFHQYFIHGETKDCSSWLTDYYNCDRWESKKDLKSFKEVVKSEEKRKEERLKAHLENDTWEKREGPPPDWNKPFPDWFHDKNIGSYLAFKEEEMKKLKETDNSDKSSSCVIS